jgi:Flp pilus assembly protein TadG
MLNTTDTHTGTGGAAVVTHRAGNRRRHRRRATVLLEFVMIMPLFMMLTMFSLDMGRIMVISGALNDATYVGARSAAQYGAVNIGGVNVVERAFRNAVDDIPGIDPTKATVVVTAPSSGVCRGTDVYIDARATYNMRLVTPWVDNLLDLFGRTWTIRTNATVLCEVVR